MQSKGEIDEIGHLPKKRLTGLGSPGLWVFRDRRVRSFDQVVAGRLLSNVTRAAI